MDPALYTSFQSILLVITAVLNILLAVGIYLRNRSRSSMFFIIAILYTAIWSFGISLYVRPGITAFTYLVSNLNYINASSIATAFLFFCIFFGTEEVKLTRLKVMAIIIPWIVIIVLILWPGLIIESLTEVGFVKDENFGPAYPFYMFYILYYFIYGLTTLFKKYRVSKGVFKTQLRYVFIGLAIAVILGVMTNIILPSLFDYPNFYWVGPLGTLGMIAFIAIAITKHGLWDFKIIVTDFLIALISVTLLVQGLFAPTPEEQLLQLGVFVLVCISSFYLLRGMLKKVDLREQLEIIVKSLAATNQKLQYLDVQKSDFVSIASHQLRTPLTVITGYTSMLLEGAFGKIEDRGHRAVIEKIYAASQNLVRMIEDFLDISKIEKGEMAYQFEKIDLKKFCEEVVEKLKDSLKTGGFKFRITTGSEGDLIVTADPGKLRQILFNLIDNAIKYTPKGGDIKISLAKDEKKGKIFFTIRDNGIGITKEMMPRLFEKFSRAEGISKLHTEGRGLGLYVAKQIIDAHGGTIHATSLGKNKGTTFTLTLPDPTYDDRRREIKSFIPGL